MLTRRCRSVSGDLLSNIDKEIWLPNFFQRGYRAVVWHDTDNWFFKTLMPWQNSEDGMTHRDETTHYNHYYLEMGSEYLSLTVKPRLSIWTSETLEGSQMRSNAVRTIFRCSQSFSGDRKDSVCSCHLSKVSESLRGHVRTALDIAVLHSWSPKESWGQHITGLVQKTASNGNIFLADYVRRQAWDRDSRY